MAENLNNNQFVMPPSRYLSFRSVILLAVVFLLAAGFYWWSVKCDFSIKFECKPNRQITEFEIDSEFIKKNELVAKLTAQVVQKQVEGLLTVGSFYANKPEMRQLVQEGKWQSAANLALAATREDENIEGISLYDMNGVLMANAADSQSRDIGRGFAHMDWYKGVTTDFEPYVSEVYVKPTGPAFNVVGLSFPVLNKDGFSAGILLLTVRTDTFFEWLNEIKFGASGKSFIVDQRGHVIAHPEIAPQAEIADFSPRTDVQKALTGKSGSEISLDLNNKRMISSYEPILEYDWAVITTIELDEVLDSGLIKN